MKSPHPNTMERMLIAKDSFKGYNVILHYYIHFCIKLDIYGIGW